MKRRSSRTPTQIFGRAVTELRTQKNVSQLTMAQKLGISLSYLVRIELGTANPTIEVVHGIAVYFRMSIGELWAYAEKLSRKAR